MKLTQQELLFEMGSVLENVDLDAESSLHNLKGFKYLRLSQTICKKDLNTYICDWVQQIVRRNEIHIWESRQRKLWKGNGKPCSREALWRLLVWEKPQPQIWKCGTWGWFDEEKVRSTNSSSVMLPSESPSISSIRASAICKHDKHCHTYCKRCKHFKHYTMSQILPGDSQKTLLCHSPQSWFLNSRFSLQSIKEKVLFMKVCFGHLFWTLVLPPALGDEVKKVLDNALHLRPADTRVSVAVKNPEQCQLYLVWSHRKLENGRPKDLPINMLRINCGFFSVKHNTIGQMWGWEAFLGQGHC